MNGDFTDWKATRHVKNTKVMISNNITKRKIIIRLLTFSKRGQSIFSHLMLEGFSGVFILEKYLDFFLRNNFFTSKGMFFHRENMMEDLLHQWYCMKIFFEIMNISLCFKIYKENLSKSFTIFSFDIIHSDFIMEHNKCFYWGIIFILFSRKSKNKIH